MMRVKRLLRNWDADSQECKFCLKREPNGQMPVFSEETLWHGLPCPHVPSRRATAKAGAKSSGLFLSGASALFCESSRQAVELNLDRVIVPQIPWQELSLAR